MLHGPIYRPTTSSSQQAQSTKVVGKPVTASSTTAPVSTDTDQYENSGASSLSDADLLALMGELPDSPGSVASGILDQEPSDGLYSEKNLRYNPANNSVELSDKEGDLSEVLLRLAAYAKDGVVTPDQLDRMGRHGNKAVESMDRGLRKPINWVKRRVDSDYGDYRDRVDHCHKRFHDEVDNRKGRGRLDSRDRDEGRIQEGSGRERSRERAREQMNTRRGAPKTYVRDDSDSDEG